MEGQFSTHFKAKILMIIAKQWVEAQATRMLYPADDEMAERRLQRTRKYLQERRSHFGIGIRQFCRHLRTHHSSMMTLWREYRWSK